MNFRKSFYVIGALLLSTVGTAQSFDQSKLVRQDFKHPSGNSVTITTYKNSNGNFVYYGGQTNVIDAYSISKKGKLTPIGPFTLSNDKGPARGIIADQINGTDYLFVGNKGASTVEVFKILKDGSLDRVFVLDDTDETYLGTVITLQVVHMKQASYLFVGGLEKIPGLSCFKIHNDGSLTHVQSLRDDDKLHTDGIIGMVTHKVKGKTYLYTGGFHDNGVSSFRVYESGRFKNVNNISDNTTDRYLTGTYPVTGVTLEGNHYVVVGHRHHKYYKRGTNFIKNMDFVYHGDGVSVFKINSRGALVPHSTFVGNESTRIAGQTRIEILGVNDSEAIVAVATKDDESIQLFKLDASGTLTPISYLKTGYPIYYGMGAIKIDGDLFFIGGSTNSDGNVIATYKVVPESPDTAGKVIRHIVSLKFKEGTTQQKIDEALTSIKDIQNKIPEIADIELGPNDSTEGLSKDFDYCVTFTFNDEHAREIYMFHQEHSKLVEQVIPLLDDIMVMDYWTKK